MRLRYLLAAAADDLWLYKKSGAAVVLCNGLALFLVGLFLLAGYNANQRFDLLRQKGRMTIYLRDSADPSAIARLKRRLGQDPQVAGFTYISREDALQLFSQTGGEAALLAELDSNPLPDSFEVDAVDRSALAALKKRYARFATVEEVQDASPWQEGWDGVFGQFSIAGRTIGGLLAGIAAAVIVVAARLHFRLRQEEVRAMRLVGAPPLWIRSLFGLEGTALGVAGGGLALVAVLGLFALSRGKIEVYLGAGPLGGHPLQFFPVEMMIGVVLAGGIVGGIGGFFSVGWGRS